MQHNKNKIFRVNVDIRNRISRMNYGCISQLCHSAANAQLVSFLVTWTKLFNKLQPIFTNLFLFIVKIVETVKIENRLKSNQLTGVSTSV